MAVKPVPTAVFRSIIRDLVAHEKAETVVEVGVYSGGLSKLIAEVPTVKRLVCVDPWYGNFKDFGRAHMDNIANGVIKWAEKMPHVDVMRMTSEEASTHFEDESIDFFETDGAHKYDFVKLDIQSWLPKVKPGGILCGDNFEYHGVYEAVDELLPERELLGKGRVWWIRK